MVTRREQRRRRDAGACQEEHPAMSLEERLRLVAMPLIGAAVLGLAVNIIGDIKTRHEASTTSPEPDKALSLGKTPEKLKPVSIKLGAFYSSSPKERSLQFYGAPDKLGDPKSKEVRTPITTGDADYDRYIEVALKNNGYMVKEDVLAGREFIVAMMYAESGFNSENKNPTGDHVGLMQLKVKKEGDTGGFAEEDLLDPEFSITKGVEHFSRSINAFDKYDNAIWWAVAGYHMGAKGFKEQGLEAWQTANKETREPTPKEIIDFLRATGHPKTAEYMEEIALFLDYIDPSDVADATIRNSYRAAGDKYFPVTGTKQIK